MTPEAREVLVDALRCAADLCLTGRSAGCEMASADDAFELYREGCLDTFDASNAFAKAKRRRLVAADFFENPTAKGLELLEVARWVEEGGEV